MKKETAKNKTAKAIKTLEELFFNYDNNNSSHRATRKYMRAKFSKGLRYSGLLTLNEEKEVIKEIQVLETDKELIRKYYNTIEYFTISMTDIKNSSYRSTFFTHYFNAKVYYHDCHYKTKYPAIHYLEMSCRYEKEVTELLKRGIEEKEELEKQKELNKINPYEAEAKIRKFIKENDLDLSIHVSHAKTTSSMYLSIYPNNDFETVEIRLSDHKPGKSHFNLKENVQVNYDEKDYNFYKKSSIETRIFPLLKRLGTPKKKELVK